MKKKIIKTNKASIEKAVDEKRISTTYVSSGEVQKETYLEDDLAWGQMDTHIPSFIRFAPTKKN